MTWKSPVRRALRGILVPAALWAAACAVPLGPGYATLKQDVSVRFDSKTRAVHVDSEYRLRNTGNQSLSFLDVRQQSARFEISDFVFNWNGQTLAQADPFPGSRNRRFVLTKIWEKDAERTLHISFDLRLAPSSEARLGFSEDAFFLPEGGWTAELLPASSVLGFGGVPPDKWNFIVDVPKDFVVHASGGKPKRSSNGDRARIRFEQTSEDPYPFVVAGRYSEKQVQSGRMLYWWTLGPPNDSAAALEPSGQKLAQQLDAYDAVFGRREKSRSPIWIVQCPLAERCAGRSSAPLAHFFGEDENAASGELISTNTVVADLRSKPENISAVVGPSLAASWLGYGRNPGFYDQEPPLSALPLFAAAVGRESVSGRAFRAQVIRRALEDIPQNAPKGVQEDPSVVRAKSLLFFYALGDRFGPQAFDNAIQHMLEARQGRGFNTSDLIAAFEQETHQNVAEFVRLWMKHPGVPEEFRSRYTGAGTPVSSTFKEKEP